MADEYSGSSWVYNPPDRGLANESRLRLDGAGRKPEMFSDTPLDRQPSAPEKATAPEKAPTGRYDTSQWERGTVDMVNEYSQKNNLPPSTTEDEFRGRRETAFLQHPVQIIRGNENRTAAYNPKTDRYEEQEVPLSQRIEEMIKNTGANRDTTDTLIKGQVAEAAHKRADVTNRRIALSTQLQDIEKEEFDLGKRNQLFDQYRYTEEDLNKPENSDAKNKKQELLDEGELYKRQRKSIQEEMNKISGVREEEGMDEYTKNLIERARNGNVNIANYLKIKGIRY